MGDSCSPVEVGRYPGGVTRHSPLAFGFGPAEEFQGSRRENRQRLVKGKGGGHVAVAAEGTAGRFQGTEEAVDEPRCIAEGFIAGVLHQGVPEGILFTEIFSTPPAGLDFESTGAVAVGKGVVMLVNRQKAAGNLQELQPGMGGRQQARLIEELKGPGKAARHYGDIRQGHQRFAMLCSRCNRQTIGMSPACSLLKESFPQRLRQG